MRRCTRCRCWKPDACFLVHDLQYKPGRCSHCRTILGSLKTNTGRGGAHVATRPPTPIERIAPTPKDAALVALARKERAAWAARGAPHVGRCYVHTLGGALVGRMSKKRISQAFTSSSFGY